MVVPQILVKPPKPRGLAALAPCPVPDDAWRQVAQCLLAKELCRLFVAAGRRRRGPMDAHCPLSPLSIATYYAARLGRTLLNGGLFGLYLLEEKRGSGTTLACGALHSAVLAKVKEADADAPDSPKKRVGQTLLVFGSNHEGQLGTTLDAHHRQPLSWRPVSIRLDAVAVSCGAAHTVVLLRSGDVVGFGRNTFGQLGETGTETCNEPVRLAACAASRRDAGGDQTPEGCSSTFISGTWLATANDTDSVVSSEKSVPTAASLGKTGNSLGAELRGSLIRQVYVHIGSGKDHTLLVNEFGELVTVGWNKFGQLGRVTGEVCAQPQAGMVKHVVSVRGGFAHSLALDVFDRLYVSGGNSHLQLGLPNDGPGGVQQLSHFTHLDIPGCKAFAISCGSFHSLVADREKGLWAFGHGTSGKLGLGHELDALPTCVEAFKDERVVGVHSGGTHSVVVLANGSVYGMGSGRRGQLGETAPAKALLPHRILTDGVCPGSNVVVACGDYHSLGYTELPQGDHVWGFGRNTRGQLGVPNGPGGVVDIFNPVNVGIQDAIQDLRNE